MALLCTIFHRLNLPLSAKKTVGPTRIRIFRNHSSYHQHAINRISSCIRIILRCTRKELEQLLGHLNFASRVILPDRSFVSYRYKRMSSVKEGYHYIHLNKEFKADLYMWLNSYHPGMAHPCFMFHAR